MQSCKLLLLFVFNPTDVELEPKTPRGQEKVPASGEAEEHLCCEMEPLEVMEKPGGGGGK